MKQLMLKGIAIIAILLCIIIIYSVVYKTEEYGKNITKSDEIEISSSGVESYIQQLETNTLHKFKVGEKYIYKFVSYGDSGGGNKKHITYDYEIKSVEIFNKTECVLIVSNQTASTDAPIKNVIVKTCIDKNGNVLFADMECFFENSSFSIYEEGKNASDMISAMSVMGTFFYSPWMLSLIENFKWTDNTSFPSLTIKSESEKYEIEKVKNDIYYNIKVAGVEKIENIKCFKVQISSILENSKTSTKMAINVILWIDADKRILVEGRMYYENLPIGEIKRTL